jgi:hypothetical protein
LILLFSRDHNNKSINNRFRLLGFDHLWFRLNASHNQKLSIAAVHTVTLPMVISEVNTFGEIPPGTNWTRYPFLTAYPISGAERPVEISLILARPG